jgi:enterochelin esterase family protein
MTSASRFLLWLAALLALAGAPRAQGFQDFITLVNITPTAQRQALVDSLMADLPGGETPIREAGRAWFLWQGTANTLALAGDMTGWQPSSALNLIGGTNFWYRQFLCEDDARLDYKFVRNGTEWLLDPRNPHTCAGGFGPNSELAMPAYVQPPEIQNHGLPNGTLVTWSNYYSPQLGNTRTIQVLLPPGYQEGVPRGVCLVHDGSEYLSLAYLRNVVAWLADQHPGLELPIFVCVPPVNRTQEYQTTQQEAFGHFITDTVLPQVRATWATHADPARWISMGASNGGNISAYLLGHYPQVFGRGVLMSPYIPDEQRQGLAALSPDSLRLYLNWGSYDLAQIIPLAEQTVAMLEQNGVPHFSRLYHEGHSWGLWRATIDEGLLYVLEAEDALPGERGQVPAGLELRAWPNPFNSRVNLSLPGGPGLTRLRVYDVLGRLREEREAPAGPLSWDAGALPSGPYWLEARRGEGRGTARVTLLR